MLCQQHGTVQFFNHSASTRHAIASFTRPDDALKAQHALNGYVIANMQLAADFIPDSDIGRHNDQSTSLSNIWSSLPNAGVPVNQIPDHFGWHGGAGSLWNANGNSTNSINGI